MDTEAQEKITRFNTKNIVILSLAIFIFLMLAIFTKISYSVLSNDKIYKGVYINDINVGDMTLDELDNILQKKFTDNVSNTYLEITAGNLKESTDFTSLAVRYDTKKASDLVYAVGRNGNIFHRLLTIAKANKKDIIIDMPVTYEKGKIDYIIDSLYEKTLVPVKSPALVITEIEVTIDTGHKGQNIDKTKALKLIEDSIRSCKGGIINIPPVITKPEKINVDQYFKKINQNPKDASFKVEKNKCIVIPHLIGRTIDKSELAAIVAELENLEDAQRVLPVVFSKPKILTDTVNKKLFSNTLYSFSTQFNKSSVNNSNRAENISIAASKINGTLLSPGQVFSFNNVVGDRTEDVGYKTAHAYVQGKIVDSVGGGICQVSTTLYNAVLFSNLQIIDRHNHMFTVGYVPFGRDAAVSYNSVDFKFKNSTPWPIKITGYVTKDNRISFSIIGTNEDPGKSVSIFSETVKTINYGTKYINDPTIEQGKNIVKSNGMTGYVVDTYKVVKKDGKVISQEKISKSSYKPLDQEVRRGTKKATVPKSTIAPKAADKPIVPVNTPSPAVTPNNITPSSEPTNETTITPIEIPSTIDTEMPEAVEIPTSTPSDV